MNDENRAEKQLEYASRVSWWIGGSDFIQIHIQNRSPVPVTEVRLRYKATRIERDYDQIDALPVHEGPPTIEIDSIPPCTIVVVDDYGLQNELLGQTAERPGRTGMREMIWAEIDFTDVHGRRWTAALGRLPEVAEHEDLQKPDLTLLSDIRFMQEEPATDCGTG